MYALVAAKVQRWETGVWEDRTWSVYNGSWVCVQHLSANGYWRTEEGWDGEGNIEKRATIQAIGEGGIFYFTNWTSFMAFLSYYLCADEIEVLKTEDV